MNDDPVSQCEVCGGEVRRVIHPVGLVFKGSGFYVTDSRASAQSSKAVGSGDSDKSSGSSDSDKASGSGDSDKSTGSGGSEKAATSKPDVKKETKKESSPRTAATGSPKD